MHGANMLLEAKQWLQRAWPHWNRTGGADHIWLVSHDEGSCWVPSELRASIILSHWGRKVGLACLQLSRGEICQGCSVVCQIVGVLLAHRVSLPCMVVARSADRMHKVVQDKKHTSNSAFHADNYSQDYVHK